jgi:hypothetical protein
VCIFGEELSISSALLRNIELKIFAKWSILMKLKKMQQITIFSEMESLDHSREL